MWSIWLVAMQSIGVFPVRPLHRTMFECTVHWRHNNHVFPHTEIVCYTKYDHLYYPIRPEMKEKKCAIFCNQENHALNHKIIKCLANISVIFWLAHLQTSTNCSVGRRISKLSCAFSIMILNRQSVCRIVGPSSWLVLAAKSSPSTIIDEPTSHVANSVLVEKYHQFIEQNPPNKKTKIHNWCRECVTIAECICINLPDNFC